MPIVRFPTRLSCVVGVVIMLAVIWYGGQGTGAQDAAPTDHLGGHGQDSDTATPDALDRSPYAGAYDPDAPIRGLDAGLVEQIRQGQGASLALPAELNGLPGPRHALDLAEQLDLSPDQRAQVQDVYDRYLANAIPAGERYLGAAQTLEEELRSGAISEEDLSGLVAEVSRREGDLVTIHLTAHLRTAGILTPEQIAVYNELRGYE